MERGLRNNPLAEIAMAGPFKPHFLGQRGGVSCFKYVAALEDVNDQLLISLKKYVEVLAQFKYFVSDPDG